MSRGHNQLLEVTHNLGGTIFADTGCSLPVLQRKTISGISVSRLRCYRRTGSSWPRVSVDSLPPLVAFLARERDNPERGGWTTCSAYTVLDRHGEWRRLEWFCTVWCASPSSFMVRRVWHNASKSSNTPSIAFSIDNHLVLHAFLKLFATFFLPFADKLIAFMVITALP